MTTSLDNPGAGRLSEASADMADDVAAAANDDNSSSDSIEPSTDLSTDIDGSPPSDEMPDGVEDGGEVAELTPEHQRMVEALLFAASEPISEKAIADRLPDGAATAAALEALRQDYADRGVQLLKVAGKWSLRTAPDLSWLLERERVEPRRLSRAGLETLAVIAYHQPVTRAEIEEIRGVSLSKGTLDLLLEIGWVRMRGRRRTPGRPLTYGTSDAFLSHFGLESSGDLPGMEDLKSAGLLDARLPPEFAVPTPGGDEISDDEDPLDADDDGQELLEFDGDLDDDEDDERDRLEE